jgi:hypothetical protein
MTVKSIGLSRRAWQLSCNISESPIWFLLILRSRRFPLAIMNHILCKAKSDFQEEFFHLENIKNSYSEIVATTDAHPYTFLPFRVSAWAPL